MKRTLLALACAAMMLPAAASWNPGDESMSPIHQQQNFEFTCPTMIRKADGSTLLAYLSKGAHVNPETGKTDPADYYYLHLQKLDKDGNMLFPEGGVIVSSQPTKSDYYGYLTMDTLTNGNIVLTHADIRDEPTELNLHVYAYCYTQQGESVWSKDGVKMPIYEPGPTFDRPRYMSPKIIVSGDNIYLISEVSESNTATHDNVLMLEIACLDYNGTVLASRLDTVCLTFDCAIAPAPNGNLYVVYINENNGYSARCVDSKCKDVWSEETVVETMSVVPPGSLAYGVAPSEVRPLNDGSLALFYYVIHGKHETELLYNRLYPDGSVLKQHVHVGDTVGQYVGHATMLEGDTFTIFTNQEHDLGQRTEYYLYFNRFLIDGTPLYDSPVGHFTDETTNITPTMLGLTKAGGYYQLLIYEVDKHFKTTQSYSYTIGLDGNRIKRKPIISNTSIYQRKFISNDHYAYIFFNTSATGAGGVWISCIDVTDYTHSAPQTGSLTSKFTVNAEGKQVIFAQSNLQYWPIFSTYIFGTRQWEILTSSNGWLNVPDDAEGMDLFGWGTGDKGNKISTSASDYPTFNEWGANTILNSSYPAGTWRTMTNSEWEYLFNGRPDAANKWTLAHVRDYFFSEDGVILLPDSFEMPAGMQMDMKAKTYDVNTYESTDWKLLEDNGAVFLPMGAYREGSKVKAYDNYTHLCSVGYYWTTTPDGNDKAKQLVLDENGLSFASGNRALGMSVRLVRDAGTTPSRIQNAAAADEDSITRKIIINGQLFIQRGDELFNAAGARLK